MTRTSLAHFNCSAARAFDLIGDKWSLLIIRDAFYGISTFSAFRSRLGMTGNVLSSRLDHLVSSGILLKVQEKPDTDRYRYVLSESGKSLFPILVAFMQWGDQWISGAGNEPVQLLEKKSRRPVGAVVLKSASGKQLKPADVTYEPGPGADENTRHLFSLARDALNE
jgi:DNA-binding HxlR family transcriptional regulator